MITSYSGIDHVPNPRRGDVMGALLLLLLLAVILAGVGFAVHVLWWVAVVVFVIWLVSLFIGRGSRSRA